MAQLQLHQISKRYTGKQTVDALHPVDLTFQDGEFVTILGPSGSGKTTLLSIIVGVTAPSTGRVVLDNQDITYADPKDRDMAMVFQNYALYPSKTVAGNLAFPLRMQKTPKPERDRRVARMAELLDLTERLGRYPRELSGGQQQRVALGRALIRQPKLFLMDEPLSNLDAKLRLQMRTEIKRLHREYPVATIYVTHDQVEAMALSDRVVVMNHGTITQIGTPTDIYQRPTDTFVATFVGSPAMNLIPSVLDTNGLTATCETTNGTLLANIAAPIATTAPTPIQLGIRPNHIRWSSLPTPGSPSVTTTIQEVDALGEDTLIYTDLDNQIITIIDHDSRHPPQPGETIHLTFPPNHLHYFHEESGQSLTQTAHQTATRSADMGGSVPETV